MENKADIFQVSILVILCVFLYSFVTIYKTSLYMVKCVMLAILWWLPHDLKKKSFSP